MRIVAKNGYVTHVVDHQSDKLRPLCSESKNPRDYETTTQPITCSKCTAKLVNPIFQKAANLINDLEDKTLVDDFLNLFKSNLYEKDNYTDLALSIAGYYYKNKELSYKQREVLRHHMINQLIRKEVQQLMDKENII